MSAEPEIKEMLGPFQCTGWTCPCENRNASHQRQNTFYAAQTAFPGQAEVPQFIQTAFFAGYRNAFIDAMEAAQSGDADAVNNKAQEIAAFFAPKAPAPEVQP